MASLTRTPLLAQDLLWFSLAAEWHTRAGGEEEEEEEWGQREGDVESAVG